MRWVSSRGIRGVPQRNDRDYAELLLDELRREDELFTKRVNLFLVAESLLLISYATFINAIGLNWKIIILIGLMGSLITLIYMLIIYRSAENIEIIRDELFKKYPNYDELKELRMKHYMKKSRWLVKKKKKARGYVNWSLLIISICFFAIWVGLTILLILEFVEI